MRPSKITVKGKSYPLPIFLPDATRAVTKSLDSVDISNADVMGVVVNTYHLKSSPGLDILKNCGGVKTFMNFDGMVVTDSGGWQVFSLIHRPDKLKGTGRTGKITDDGVFFPISNSKYEVFTPEISIQTQFDINSDIIICLDDFTPPQSSADIIEKSVHRTINWAKRSKEEYLKQLKLRKLNKNEKPLIFSVIQGGESKEFRKLCTEELIKIGFDGYGFGGYLINEKRELNMDLMEYMVNLIPEGTYRFALGTGTPDQIKACYELGWDIFDCTLPTRDARHKRLYINSEQTAKEFEYLYLAKGRYASDKQAIDPSCDCHTCKNFTRSYVHHLFKINDVSAMRLASIHNLHFFTNWMQKLK